MNKYAEFTGKVCVFVQAEDELRKVCNVLLPTDPTKKLRKIYDDAVEGWMFYPKKAVRVSDLTEVGFVLLEAEQDVELNAVPHDLFKVLHPDHGTICFAYVSEHAKLATAHA